MDGWWGLAICFFLWKGARLFWDRLDHQLHLWKIQVSFGNTGHVEHHIMGTFGRIGWGKKRAKVVCQTNNTFNYSIFIANLIQFLANYSTQITARWQSYLIFFHLTLLSPKEVLWLELDPNNLDTIKIKYVNISRSSLWNLIHDVFNIIMHACASMLCWWLNLHNFL